MPNMLDSFFAKRTLKEAYTEERALFLSTLLRTSREGNLCWRSAEAPDLPPSIIEEGKDRFPKTPVVRQGDRYYLQRNWVLETHLLEQIERLSNLVPPPCHDAEVFQRELALAKLLPTQKQAVKGALQKSFSIICGGPGTGKTYTAGVLVRLLMATKTKERYKVILAAPTGKAAAHLQSVLGSCMEATTIHRLLHLVPGENRLFSHRTIDADLMIVDEASMLDISLLVQLLESVGRGTRLVLMGDPDQLPPIEASSIFREMAALFGTCLPTSMRVENRELHALAKSINCGEEVGRSCLLQDAFDSLLPKKLFEKINPILAWEPPDPLFCLKELDRFRVLGALRQGPFGIDSLNRQIVQEIDRCLRPGQWWAVPIMIIRNQSEQNLYNGSCGILIGKSRGGLHFQDAIAYFPEPVPYRKLPSFEIAFCLSIHKSQGSEFERVLALFPPGSELFGREAVYTAVTRAKKEVQILTEETILQGMLAKRSVNRSGLKERMETNSSSRL